MEDDKLRLEDYTLDQVISLFSSLSESDQKKLALKLNKDYFKEWDLRYLSLDKLKAMTIWRVLLSNKSKNSPLDRGIS